MCGIAGIISKQGSALPIAEKIVLMSNLLKHRGPDGEGFITIEADKVVPRFGRVTSLFKKTELPYAPVKLPEQDNETTMAAFAHRRLSIIDLSESGHQPMCHAQKTLWITYNGEVYNFIELRQELRALGHSFVSESDTEVILAAYRQWGERCVERFNGMWAFCIYDSVNKTFFASRDRLGVKPFYYVNNTACFAFASEQKALCGAGIVEANMNQKALHNYLVNGLLETETNNFFEGISELWPGHNLFYDFKLGSVETKRYFHLRDCISLENDSLPETQLIEKINEVLENAIRLRLRSDVEVGTCLSGGIDSSVLAGVMAGMVNQPVHCFTAVFSKSKINEDVFASTVAHHIGGKHHKVEPDFEIFLKEIDALVYALDAPIWSTSTYAQYKVMELAKLNGIKVVLDGQGADELFGGYHHHFLAKWNNLLKYGKFGALVNDINASRLSINKPFLFYGKQMLKQFISPQDNAVNSLLDAKFVQAYDRPNVFELKDDVNTQLVSDIYDTRLKTFLRCEDRCGMWHSVESRTPFSDDVALMKLVFSFNGNKKIQKGISKYLLREAAKTKLPERIYKRYDKKGFETPMEEWMQKMHPQLLSEIKEVDFDFVNFKNLERSNKADDKANKLLFKLFILMRWQKNFKK